MSIDRSLSGAALLTIGLLGGCECERHAPVDAAVVPPTPVVESVTPPRRGRERETCAFVGEPRVVSALTAAPTSVAVAQAGGTEWFLVDDEDSTSMFAQPSSGRTERLRRPRRADRTLFALEAFPSDEDDPTSVDRALVVTLGPCSERGPVDGCLFAESVVIAPGTLATSEEVRITIGARPRTMRSARTGDSFYLARNEGRVHPVLERMRVPGDGRNVVLTHTVLGQTIAEDDDAPLEILGVTATGGGHAVLFRKGAAEGGESSVTLSTQLDEHQVGALAEALVVESLEWLAGDLVLIAAFEFSRPVFLRMTATGELLGEPRPLAAGDDVPRPFASRRVARLEGPPFRLEIRDGAGHATAPLFALPEDATSADVDHEGDDFLVALTDGLPTLRAAKVRCRAR